MGMDVFGRNPSSPKGKYFRASIWSWSPILHLITRANKESALGLDLRGWDCNDAFGCESAEESIKLADAIEAIIGKMSPATDVVMVAPEQANKTAKVFASLFAVESPSLYQADKDQVHEFCTFLRSCGGFKIC